MSFQIKLEIFANIVLVEIGDRLGVMRFVIRDFEFRIFLRKEPDKHLVGGAEFLAQCADADAHVEKNLLEGKPARRVFISPP